MTLGESIGAFFDSPVGQAALAVLIAGSLDLLLGVLAAFRDDRFSGEMFGEWLRFHLAGQILPIWALLFVGFYAQGVKFANIPLILTAGVAAAGIYVLEVVATILRVWGPNRKAKVVEPDPDI